MYYADRVVLLTSDRDYIVPSLVAACQIADQRRRIEEFDILVLLLGFSSGELEVLKAEFEPRGVVIQQMKHDLFDQSVDLHFEKSHVPISAMARLSSAAYLGDRHRHVIYVDGDIQTRGDIRPLLGYDVPDGHILAATDRYIISKSSTGYSGQRWRAARLYLDRLHIDDPADYFNSGVLAACRETWAEICSDA